MQRMTGREGDLVLINGQSRPQLTARPGARERWRIVNACVARYLRLRLDGRDLRLLGIDLPLGVDPQQVQEVLLAPGNRADLLVTMTAGTSFLQALPYDRGTAMGMGMGGMGSPGTNPGGEPLIELATLAVSGPPTVAPGSSFTIDGRGVDPARVDQTAAAGAMEEWTITNTSQMDPPSICTSGPCRCSPSPAPTWVRRPGRTSSTCPPAAAPSSASGSTATPSAPCTTVTSSITRTTA